MSTNQLAIVNTHTDQPLTLPLSLTTLSLVIHVGALVTNRVLCLVPLVAWFEDWMFVRKFEMLNDLYVTIEVVGKYRTVYMSLLLLINH